MIALRYRWRRSISRLQQAGIIAVVIGLVMIGTAWVSGSAGADTGITDQITGAGTSPSTVTVNWSDGLLGADNKTMVTPRSQGSLNPDFYNGSSDEFKNLKVTVSQTEDITHQAIAISWTGATPTPTTFGGDYMQIMQCYGDASTGPDPEDCEYGSTGLLPGNIFSDGTTTRGGTRCPAAAVSSGCDPDETGTAHLVPNLNSASNYYVPFAPVGTDTLAFNTNDTGLLTNYFDKFSTNEVQQAVTNVDGTGQQYFQTLTGVQAPALGCGEIESNGQARDCWLVIVPRGEFKPNGYQIAGASGPGAFISDSPLGASNWAQRIQVHLDFDPIPPACPIGSADERQMVGTELAADAVFSWQLALNQQAKCSKIYGYTSTPEATSTSQLQAGTVGGAAGLAFTTIPIGSESGRENGVTTTTTTPIKYAPVAVSALQLGFQINLLSGTDSTPVKLTPRLLAKALTQSYQLEQPGYTPSTPNLGPLPSWAVNNPADILQDPEFEALNPSVNGSTGSATPLAPLLTEDHSAENQQLWQWILADPSARAWLGGSPDPSGMVINPAYQALQLGAAPIDSFPRADPNCVDTGQGTPGHPSTRCSLDLLPYVNGYSDAAVHIRSANNPEGASWDPTATAPDGSTGWWSTGSIEPAGKTFLWGIVDSDQSAAFGLVPAQLCDADGSNCVGPNTQSVTSALASASADGSGLLHVNPSAAPAGAYPLVDVTYAAVKADDDPTAVTDYADFIAYAAGTGQTPGDAPGDLPRGYLPLPANLQAQAKSAAAALGGVAPVIPPAVTDSGSGHESFDSSGSSPGSGPFSDQSETGGGAGASAANPHPSATPPATPGPAAVDKPTSTPTVYATPASAAPAARYAALGVILAALGGLAGRPVTRYLGRRRIGGSSR